MSRRIGMKDIYIAPITKNDIGEYTTDTPQKLARAIGGKVKEKWNSEKTYSDDALEENVRSFEGVEIELEVNKLSNEKKALIYGYKLENGSLTSAIEDTAKDVAIGWRNKCSNGKYDFVWYYVCSVEDGEEGDNETLGDKPKAQSDKIKLVGRAREKSETNGRHIYKHCVSEDELLDTNTDAKTALMNWFTTVQEPIIKK